MTRTDMIRRIKIEKPKYFSAENMRFFNQKMADFRFIQKGTLSILWANSIWDNRLVGISVVALDGETMVNFPISGNKITFGNYNRNNIIEKAREAINKERGEK